MITTSLQDTNGMEILVLPVVHMRSDLTVGVTLVGSENNPMFSGLPDPVTQYSCIDTKYKTNVHRGRLTSPVDKAVIQLWVAGCLIRRAR